MDDAKTKFGLSVYLIFGILRHLDEEAALKALEEGLNYRTADGRLAVQAIGLDSSEVGNPPEKFERLYEKARQAGLKRVAHAGEEGPTSYVWGSLRNLQVQRIDHGVRSLEDPELVAYLAKNRIPLTVCPLSNVRLRVFDKMTDHVLPKLLEANLVVTINSDDPAYFGGYLNDNFLAITHAFALSKKDVARLCANGIEATFLDESNKQKLVDELRAYCRLHGFESW